MALTGFNGIVYPPFPPAITTAAIAMGANMLLDASGEKGAFVFQAPKTGSIRKIGVRFNTVTTPTDTDFRLETVDGTTGFPSGALFGTNTNVTVASASITSNTFVLSGALTADASVTKGQYIALVIAPSGSPNFNVALFSQPSTYQLGITYSAAFLSAAWSKSGTWNPFAVEYSDGSYAYIVGAIPASAVVDQAIASNTTPDEIALKFTLAAPARVAGMWAMIDPDADWDYVLYDSDGTTVLATASVDATNLVAVTDRYQPFLFATPVELTAGVARYATVKPTSTTGIGLALFDVPSAAAMDQMPGGQNFHYAARTDAGAWAATTTRRPLIGLLIDQISDGVGGGGPLAAGRLAI